MPDLLLIENLKVSLRNPQTNHEGRVLRGLDLSMKQGERLALVGESGCGKSMTALSILRLLPTPPMKLSEGRILFKGRDLAALTPEEMRDIRGKEIGMVFQEPFVSLNPVMRVGKQLSETLRIHLGLSGDATNAKGKSLLSEVGLPDPERIMGQYPHQLSGGMCQRVMIAMAIACGPSLLVADEPTTALDVTVQSQILDLLFRMTEQHKMAVLFITHDLRIVRGHSNRVAILYLGQVVEEGMTSRIFEHPQHPYTEGLLESLPSVSRRGKDLYSIGGAVPSPFEATRGCTFAGRCPRVQVKCREVAPDLEEFQKGHKIRCFYPSGR